MILSSFRMPTLHSMKEATIFDSMAGSRGRGRKRKVDDEGSAKKKGEEKMGTTLISSICPSLLLLVIKSGMNKESF